MTITRVVPNVCVGINDRWHAPADLLRCRCGANTYCPVCGNGSGSRPCECDGILRSHIETRLDQTYGTFDDVK